jgi:hypothetical protein
LRRSPPLSRAESRVVSSESHIVRAFSEIQQIAMEVFWIVNDRLRESSRSFRWLARKLLSRARQRTAESPKAKRQVVKAIFARLGHLSL